VLLRSHELKRQGDHPPNDSFPLTRSNMDALQADTSAIPDVLCAAKDETSVDIMGSVIDILYRDNKAEGL
jgi:hypothetical protein